MKSMGLFSNSRDRQQAQLVAPQYLKIAKDCIKLINSTTNPDVFFPRYDLLIEQCSKLSQLECYIKFTGTRPSTQLITFKLQRDEETRRFIHRSFEKLKQDVDKLKTAKAKGNKVDSYFAKMSIYSRYISANNQKLLEEFEAYFKKLETAW